MDFGCRHAGRNRAHPRRLHFDAQAKEPDDGESLTGANRAIRGFDFFPGKETTVEFMKTLLATAAVVGLLAPSVFGQAEQIIKQRAKELSNQNNVRQGVAPPTPAAPPPTARPPAPTAAATPPTAQ